MHSNLNLDTMEEHSVDLGYSWRSGLMVRLGVYALITVVFTLVLLNYALRHGRLAVGPTDDDCVYFVDALQRLDLLHISPKTFFANFLQHPPHSPFSTSLAVVAFAVLGPHQWAPYAFNGLLVFALLVGIDYLTAGSSPITRIASVLFALSFPFTANVVTEFRPDCAVGIATGFGLILLLRRSPLTASTGHALAVGFLAALALLIKPTFAPLTILAFGMAGLLSLFFVHWNDRPRDLPMKEWLGRIMWYVLPPLLLAGPYYIISSDIFRYIHNQAFGKYREAWAMKDASAAAVIRYHWNGPGGQMMLGKDRYVLMFLGLVAILLLPNRASRHWRFLAAYFLLLAVNYLVPTSTRMANPFFGTNVDVLLLLGAVLLLVIILDRAGTNFRSRSWLTASGGIAVVVSLMTFHWPPAHYNKGGEWAQTVNRLSDQLYCTIRDYPGSHNGRVFFTAPGPVDDMLFRYRGAVDGLKFWCPNRHLSSNLDVFRKEIDSADFVVASDPENGLVYESMIAPNIEAAALQMARENPNLNELVSFPGLGGKFFHVFVRRYLPPSSTAAKSVPFEDPWRPLYGLD